MSARLRVGSSSSKRDACMNTCLIFIFDQSFGSSVFDLCCLG